MIIAFSRFFQREKVPDRADEGQRVTALPTTVCAFGLKARAIFDAFHTIK